MAAASFFSPRVKLFATLAHMALDTKAKLAARKDAKFKLIAFAYA